MFSNNKTHFIFQDIDFPEFTETELKELSLKFPCRVELFHSNVCHGVERSWPHRIFRRSKFHDLLPRQKRILVRTMIRDAVKLYNEYVDEDRLKKRRRKQTNRALASYYEERYLRNRFNRIKALGDTERDAMSDSECSVTTVINTMENESVSNVSTAGKHGDSSANESDGEIPKNSRIVYEHSSEDDMEACLSFMDKFSPIQIQPQVTNTRVLRSHSKHVTTSAITAPTSSESLATITTSNIEQPNQMSTHMFSDDPNIDDSFNIEHDNFGGIAMLVEVIEETRTTFARKESIDNVEISDDSFSDDEGVLIIDERFNDLVSPSLESMSIAPDSNDDIEPVLCSTPHINSSEFLPINTVDIRRLRASFEESLELLLSPINQIRTSIQEQVLSHNVSML